VHLEALQSEEVQRFIKSHENDDPHRLVLQTSKWPDLPIKEIAAQIQSRQKAKDKLPEWYNTEGIIFPDSKYLEQASSEVIARYKAGIVQGKHLLDLTGGTGVDSFYLSKSFESCTYVENNSDLLDLATHNFKQLGAKKIQCVESSAEDFLNRNTTHLDCIFIDPSRKRDGKKVFKMQDCEPDVLELLPKLREQSDRILLKASPMLDVSLAINQLERVDKVHIISIDNDCKELLFELTTLKSAEPEIETINFIGDGTQGFRFSMKMEETAKAEFSQPLSFLYEPNSSMMKSGAFKLIGEEFGLKKLHVNTHLYTSEHLHQNFPGRVFKIDLCEPFNWKALKRLKGKQANLAVRNFPHSVADIRIKLGIRDGGDDYLFFARSVEEQLYSIITQKVE